MSNKMSANLSFQTSKMIHPLNETQISPSYKKGREFFQMEEEFLSSPTLRQLRNYKKIDNSSPNFLSSISPCKSLLGTSFTQITQSPLNKYEITKEISSPKKKTGKWTPEEDQLLMQIAPTYGERHWRKVSQHMKGRTAIQCLHRWTKILKPGLVKGPWTLEEDEKLLYWVGKKGPSKWAQCAHFIPGRSGKQCRERWFNNLNPNVKKGDWTSEEDDKIFILYKELGSSWSKIANHFTDRTENSIKNRFYSTIRKLYSDQKKTEKKMFSKETRKIVKKEPKKMIENIIKKEEFNEEKTKTNIDEQNTLYQLLKTSNVTHPPHIYNIYSSGIYKTSRRRRKTKKTKLDLNGPIESTHSTNYTHDTMVNKMEDTDSECNFESLLNTLECSLNKEMINKELDSLKDLSLEELQSKVLAYCQEENEPKKKLRNCELEEILNKQIENEILNYGKIRNNENGNDCLEKILQNEIVVNSVNDENFESDKKMFILVQQLQTLENILTHTRQELLSIENSLQIKGETNFNQENQIDENLFNASGIFNGLNELV